jgi:hypothetical protein
VKRLLKLDGINIEVYCEVDDATAAGLFDQGFVEAPGPAPYGVRYFANGDYVERPAGVPDHFILDPATLSWRACPVMSPLAVRVERDRLLVECDWTQLPDVPLETRDAWAAYRQALRDLTDQPGFPGTVVWPVPPK